MYDMPRLILLRVFRPDRLPFALVDYIKTSLGEEFILQSPFSMEKTYEFTTAKTPVLFILYPGVDPTTWVEDYGRQSHGIKEENGLFINISMGQGQENRANEMIKKMSSIGGWIFLQNIHLMQSWLPYLDETIETLSPHPNFRLFISAEPPPLSSMKNIPEGLLQTCICISNEPPSDLKANMTRGWSTYSQARIDSNSNPSFFKGCLFGLVFFHSIMLGRRRFGFQGWSRNYGFNMGDLKICSDILESYLNKIPSASSSNLSTAAVMKMIPWQDFRYIFGEIMYGGHITDYFDRRTNNTYLNVIFNEKLLNKVELAPKLVAPEPSTMNYDLYLKFIKEYLPLETPSIYGLHPNAEIGFLTSSAEYLFNNMVRLNLTGVAATASPAVSSSAGGSGAGGSGEEKDGGTTSTAATVSTISAVGSGGSTGGLRDMLQDLMKRCPPTFHLIELANKAKQRLLDADGPYIVVLIQECTRINVLLNEISFSLDELQKGKRSLCSLYWVQLCFSPFLS
jgi:dynein heavy chain